MTTVGENDARPPLRLVGTAEEVHRAELVEDDAGPPVPVDPPEQRRTIDATILGARVVDRRPVVPGWMRSRAEARQLAGWLARYGAHISAFHTSRLPLYATRLAARAPRGGWRVLLRVVGWVFDSEQSPLRADAVRRNATGEYLTLSRQRNTRVRQRGTVLAVVLVALLAGGWVFTALAPSWWQAVALVLGVAALGVVGTKADRRVLDVATVSPMAPPRLDAASVTRALLALGIGEMNKKGAAISFPGPITRDGPGWRADVDLPYGVTPQDVMEKRRELASGLRRNLGCVWPEPAREQHAGRLVLWVGDLDLAKSKQGKWPLATTGKADLFQPVPFGTDQRGRVVSVTLMFASMVIGSIPRMGKTFSLRLLLLAAALDVLAELHLYDLKGTGDLSALAPVAHAYRAGDDEDDIEYALADMRALAAELRRRTKVIRNLPRDLCPENKITRELAEKRSLGLHPIVVGCDECQRWFENPQHGKELEAIAEDLVRRGPAAGITAIFATQRPDAKSLPTGISGNAVLRFCLKVMGHAENDMVLGTSAHKNGLRATIFTRKDLGIGYLSGEDDEPQITRTYYVDSPAAEVIVTRARAMREQAGTLSGHALGDGPEDLTPAASLLDDVRAVWADATVTGYWSEDLLPRLAELRPGLYGGWDSIALGKALAGNGVETKQISRTLDGRQVNRRGVLLDDLTTALAGRGDQSAIGVAAPDAVAVDAATRSGGASGSERSDQGSSGVAVDSGDPENGV